MTDEHRKCIICGVEPATDIAMVGPPVRCASCVESSELWIEPIPMADWEGDTYTYPSFAPSYYWDGFGFYLGAGTIYGLSKTTYQFASGAGVAAFTGPFYIAGTGTFSQ